MKWTRPRNFVKSQLKILTPVGMAISMVMNAEKGVDIRACTHREEVVQPDDKGEKGDDDKRPDHRDIAKESFFRKGGHDFGKDAKGGQNQNIDLRMAPGPDQVDIHHRVAAAARREKMHAEIAVEREQSKRGRQNGKGKDDQDHGSRGRSRQRSAFS